MVKSSAIWQELKKKYIVGKVRNVSVEKNASGKQEINS